MARPPRCRRVCAEPKVARFAPEKGKGEAVVLSIDEYEAIRLIDHEKRTHEQTARQMDISRTTVTEIYESARSKIAESIVNGRPLEICGGRYRICDGSGGGMCGKACEKAANYREPVVNMKGENQMRIAVTYENGNIFQHFGHTQQFKFYDVEDGRIVAEQVVTPVGSGHGALAGYLFAYKVDALICGGIGGGAQMALAQVGIRLFGGVSGSADEAVKALIEGKLDFNPNVRCDHHDHHHGEGHTCGDHGCGSHDHEEGGHCGHCGH